MTNELKLMGWKPLESLEYFGERLFPPEYQEGIDAFSESEPHTAYQMMYRRHCLEKGLPQPGFIVGLLLDQKGKRDMAAQYMDRAAGDAKYDPATLAEIARWEFAAEKYDDARRHAESALQLWPKHSVATHVIKQLDDVASRE
jgi:tetratricopeptide (TPR) repeat protein